MIERCGNPANAAFKYYGGRGVTVCEEWLRFDAFVRDMGNRPEGMTLDRIDPNGDYEPVNCRWAGVLTQQRNRRGVKNTLERAALIRQQVGSGRTQTDVAREHGIHTSVVSRIVRGEIWS